MHKNFFFQKIPDFAQNFLITAQIILILPKFLRLGEAIAPPCPRTATPMSRNPAASLQQQIDKKRKNAITVH